MSPIEYKHALLFEEYFQSNDERYEYKKIDSILFYVECTTRNFIVHHLKIVFKILINKTIINLSSNTIILFGSGNKKINQAKFVYSIVAKKTFNTRLDRYKRLVIKNGGFYYTNEFFIKNNGDIEKHGNFIDNIKDAKKEKRIQIGDSFSSILGGHTYNNPYELVIWNVKKKNNILGIKRHLRTNIYRDTDVIKYLIHIVFEKGKII